MICRCFGKTLDLTAAGALARQTAQAMLGVGNYEVYVAHLATRHPGREPPSRAEFNQERQKARFSGSLRCC